MTKITNIRPDDAPPAPPTADMDYMLSVLGTIRARVTLIVAALRTEPTSVSLDAAIVLEEDVEGALMDLAAKIRPLATDEAVD
jgi:hypothetical protein